MLIKADARLLPIRSDSVNCVVTSPPYWGLRDYGNPAQIGLEKTPEAYVESIVGVFREVWRVLKADGTVWLNLGDSYASIGRSERQESPNVGAKQSLKALDRDVVWAPREKGMKDAKFRWTLPGGIKPKDLVGIPWRVAFALQAPFYSGHIKRLDDRVWLAAMLDAEGCLFIHKRKAGQSNGQGYFRQNDTYSPGVEICNTSLLVVERIAALVGKGSISTSDKGAHGRKQTLYRWNLRTTESRDFVAEIYPYLIAKQQQARIMCGCPSSGEKAEVAHAALIGLHNGIATSVDFPSPPSLFSPGWYLRSDIIWAKSNPMPESVTDRCTKAHEYLFLLAKSERYFYDADAIKENTDSPADRRLRSSTFKKVQQIGHAKSRAEYVETRGRNKRSVWTINSQPVSDAHFATMPEALVEPCILAGCPMGGLVLDPFIGSGTVGRVAERFGRRWVGTDLSYQGISRKRTAQRGIQWELPRAGRSVGEENSTDGLRTEASVVGRGEPSHAPSRGQGQS